MAPERFAARCGYVNEMFYSNGAAGEAKSPSSVDAKTFVPVVTELEIVGALLYLIPEYSISSA